MSNSNGGRHIDYVPPFEYIKYALRIGIGGVIGVVYYLFFKKKIEKMWIKG